MEMQTRPKWKPLRMVGYGRVSTDEEKQLYSLENQLMFFNEFAQSHNYKLVDIYTDAAVKIGLSR